MTESNITILTRMYDCFSARDIDGVLSALDPNVEWANGMDGGHEHGLDAVRAYWSRQWALIKPSVVPVRFRVTGEDTVLVTVQQTIRDLDGMPLQDQAHGLHDRLVGHAFRFRDGQVIRFDIKDVDPEVP